MTAWEPADAWRMECPCCHMWTVLLDRDMRLVGTEGFTVTATSFAPREVSPNDRSRP